MWSPYSADSTPTHYNGLNAVDRETHNILVSLKVANVQAMFEMNKNHIVSAYQRFPSHIEADIDDEGGTCIK